jgi:hypothetical protein
MKGLRKAAIERVVKPGRRQEYKIMVHSQKAFGRVLANAPHTELKPTLRNIRFRVGPQL